MSANHAVFSVAVMARVGHPSQRAAMGPVLGVSNAGFYAWRERAPSARQVAGGALLARVQDVHVASRDTYGAPRVHAALQARGERHDRKIHPYLLRGVRVSRPDQAWAMDITDVPMARGFVCWAAGVDWYSNRVLSWRLSITMDAAFCVEALEEALGRNSEPDIFDTDQGSQFTSQEFTGLLPRAGIAISMDGKGV